MKRLSLRILETPEEMFAVEELQRVVWPGDDTEVVPCHMLIAVIQNGGLMIGAYAVDDETQEGELVGFVFGFPGFRTTDEGLRLIHCSHQAGVHPDYRDAGLGFTLKRAQWQFVRRQGLDHITWTYDPLMSRNANLNIAKLGAVCNTYLQDYYGELRDGLNVGLPTDRFMVDWWVNTRRVQHRLSSRPRGCLSLDHYLASGTKILNPAVINDQGWLQSAEFKVPPEFSDTFCLVEIPADFLALKAAAPDLALGWRLDTRALLEDLFARGYLVTDFVYLRDTQPRSYYVLSHGESQL
jgi:predicted GNAT superfamily acetyltransferase